MATLSSDIVYRMRVNAHKHGCSVADGGRGTGCIRVARGACGRLSVPILPVSYRYLPLFCLEFTGTGMWYTKWYMSYLDYTGAQMLLLCTLNANCRYGPECRRGTV